MQPTSDQRRKIMKQEQVQRTKTATRTKRATARRADRLTEDHRSPSGRTTFAN